MTTTLEKMALAMMEAMPSFVGEGPEGDPNPTVADYVDCGTVDFKDIARAALLAIRGMDGHGVEMNWWSERMVDAILAEKPE